MLAPRTQTLFGTTLARHAAHGPSKIALAFADRDLSYAELLRRAATSVGWLAEAGIGRGEIVGVTIPEELPHLVVSLALLLLGVPHVCLPSQEPEAKRVTLAARLGVRRIVADDRRRALPGLELLLPAPERTASAESSLPDAIEADADAPALYYASSGTTGEPKLFALSQRALAWRAERIAESERAEPGYRSLTFVPIEDTMAKSRMITCAWLGFASVVPDGRALSQAPELCRRHRVSSFELTTLQASSLAVDATAAHRIPEHTRVYTAGAVASPALRRAFAERFGVPLLVHYGAREFGRISSTLPDAHADFESVGTPVPWIDLEIVDGEGGAVAPGTVGEIRVRSECMCHEYHGDPIASARHFRAGWFYPGDLASLAQDGRLRLYGRSDDMMNLNGIKIFPAEIERVLEEHPAVKEAAAFAKPSAAHGDIPLAAVVLHASASVPVAELLARARARLGVRAPRRIIVLDALPRNAAGKVLNRELLELASGP